MEWISVKLKKAKHKLFNCPTFWKIKPSFKCPSCGKTYRCYWDGNDIDGVGINYCDNCTETIEAITRTT